MFSMQVSIAFANHVFLLEEISFYDGIFEKKFPRVASVASVPTLLYFWPQKSNISTFISQASVFILELGFHNFKF